MIPRIAFVCAVSVIVRPALAGADDLALARRHFDAGKALAKKNRPIEAIAEFEKARAAADRPSIVFSLGGQHEKLALAGDDAHMIPAIESFERYLFLEPKAEDRADVRARIGALAPRRAAIEERERARVAAEAERARQAEAERVKQAEAERVKQAAEAERAQRAAEARACAEAAAKAEAKESEQAAQAKQPVPMVAVAREELAAPSRSRSRTVMAALLGVGGAAILAGGGLLIGSVVQSDSGARAKLLDDWATHYETAEAMRLAGAITAGVGGALAIGGILAAALPKREPRTGIWIAPAAGGVAAGGRF